MERKLAALIHQHRGRMGDTPEIACSQPLPVVVDANQLGGTIQRVLTTRNAVARASADAVSDRE
jgi:hypothetical protein